MHDVLLGAAAAAHHIYLAAVPDPGSGIAPPGSDKLLLILKYAAYCVTLLCIGGVLGVAGKMAMSHHRGESAEHMRGLGLVMMACVLTGSASALVGAVI